MSTPVEPALRVVVDRARCIGAATCVLEAPDVFVLDDGYQAVARAVAGAEPERLRRAVAGCPVGALALIADETEHLVSP